MWFYIILTLKQYKNLTMYNKALNLNQSEFGQISLVAV